VNAERVAAIASAVLYEGYILYPYRPSALKNRQRFNFGVLAPRSSSAADHGVSTSMQTQCLVRIPQAAGGHRSSAPARLTVCVRCLHLATRRVERVTAGTADASSAVADVIADNEWQEAAERAVAVEARLIDLEHEGICQQFVFDAARNGDPHTLADEEARVVRTHERICGETALSASAVADGLWRVTVRIENTTPVDAHDRIARGEMLPRAMVSTHALLHITGGEFVSLLDPPADLAERAAECVNVGAWPVLVGEEGDRDAILASPIILYDYPQIAPESAGDFFDGTEIDEMLVLRILTMTEGEKNEMRAGDPRARRLLEQTESLPDEHLARLHGALRGLRPARSESRHE